MRYAAAIALSLWCGLATATPIAVVSPLSYDLTLAPDAGGGVFRGEERLTLALESPSTRIRLDAVDLAIDSASAIVGPRTLTARVRRLPDAIELVFESPLPAGTVEIELAWHGPLGDTPRGLYRVGEDGRQDVFTQLEPNHARRVFPCIDVPGKRARFTLHVVTDIDDEAIANGSVISELPEAGHQKRVTFAPTPPLPTYLVSLAVGRFDAAVGKSGEIPVRVLAPPGHHHEAETALAATIFLLDAFEQYLGVAFPFAKLDVVAVPHFGPHAMENAGAIFVRSDELLVDDLDPTAVHLRARRLAHELAHQWFGDLVTMATWNDLWLAEGLARWAEFEILDRVHADWNIRRELRALHDKMIGLDDRARTHAIRARLLGPAFDPITYDKGAATVRMLQVWMGDDAFRAGLRRYLTTRAFGAASSDDFWAALGGPSIVALARGWFERSGHPRLSVDLRCAGDTVDVELRQDARAPWKMPLVLTTPSTTLHVMLRRAHTHLRLREPGGCERIAVADDAELPFAVRYARAHDRESP